MRNRKDTRGKQRKGRQGLVLASLLGIVAVAVIGGFILLKDDGPQPAGKATKPTVQVSR